MQTQNLVTVIPEIRETDISGTVHFLSSTYWGKNIAPDIIEKSIRNSYCFSLLLNDALIGFARVISDCARQAWLADVFVLPELRGRGFSKQLCNTVLNDPRFSTCTWMLATKDAHDLYRQFGFEPLTVPERFMRREVK